MYKVNLLCCSAGLATFELEYPRYIHAELLTHRMFSRNSQSSRATPINTIIKDIEINGVTPPHWYKNQKGMVGGDELDPVDSSQAEYFWDCAKSEAIKYAKKLADLGVHKQHVNRLLEPFCTIKTIVTGDDEAYENFFNLRCAPDAQPEIRELALQMEKAFYDVNQPLNFGVHHLPYVNTFDITDINRYCNHVHYNTAILCGSQFYVQAMVSGARCARVSYLKHDGIKPTVEEDLKLAIRLIESKHMTPFEHCAVRALGGRRCANFTDWMSFRFILEQDINNPYPLWKSLKEQIS